MLTIGGGSSDIVHSAGQLVLNWTEDASHVWIHQFFHKDATEDSKTLFRLPNFIKTYKPYVQQLDGRIVLVDGGLVSQEHWDF